MTVAVTRFKFLAHSGFPSQRFSAADVIFKEGSKGDKIYVIRTGEVVTERNAMSSRW
jgi:CRP-like cAMP-binding protein